MTKGKMHSLIRVDHIEYAMWLAFDKDGGVRLTRGQPSLDRNERAMSLLVKVPKALFATPQLSAKINIEDPGIPQPQIDIAAAQEALRQVVGCDVEIAVTTPPGEPAEPQP